MNVEKLPTYEQDCTECDHHIAYTIEPEGVAVEPNISIRCGHCDNINDKVPLTKP